MSRYEVTEEELQDTERAWNSNELFKLSNAQLHSIIAARGLAAESDANKKALVHIIVQGQKSGASLTNGTDEEDAMENEGGVKRLDARLGHSDVEMAGAPGGSAGGPNEAQGDAPTPERLQNTDAQSPILTDKPGGSEGPPNRVQGDAPTPESKRGDEPVVEEKPAGSEGPPNRVQGDAPTPEALRGEGVTQKDVAAHAAESDENAALLGTDLISGEVETADGVFIPADDLANRAFERSGLSREDWNAMEQEIRDTAIQTELENIRNGFDPEERDKEAERKEKAAQEARKSKKKEDYHAGGINSLGKIPGFED